MLLRSIRSYIGYVNSVEVFTRVVGKGRVRSATISIMSERVRETSLRRNIR